MKSSDYANVSALTFESVQLRAVSVPLRFPIVAKVGNYTHWPLILIDVHTREGVTGHSYLEPYAESSIPAICSIIQVLAEKFKGKPEAEQRLIDHITTGEKAKFPDGHEEEHKIVKTSPPKDMAQIKNLVQWILAQ